QQRLKFGKAASELARGVAVVTLQVQREPQEAPDSPLLKSRPFALGTHSLTARSNRRDEFRQRCHDEVRLCFDCPLTGETEETARPIDPNAFQSELVCWRNICS